MREQGGESGRLGELPALLCHIQADGLDRLTGLLPRLFHVTVARIAAVREQLLVGADPVGQGTEAEEVVLEFRPGRQPLSARLPGRREPAAGQLSDTP